MQQGNGQPAKIDAMPLRSNVVKCMLQKHVEATQSDFAKHILNNWEESLPKFVCVLPNDYARMMQMMKEVESSGLSGDEAMMAAFDLNMKDVARVTGN